MKVLTFVLCLLPTIASANGVVIYQVNSLGDRQYHKPAYVIEGNKIIQVDTLGRKQYHKPILEIKGNKNGR